MGSLLDASAATARENQEIATFKSVDAIGNPDYEIGRASCRERV